MLSVLGLCYGIPCLSMFWGRTGSCMVASMWHAEAGKTKTSLGREKQTRDSAGFPLARLSKTSTVQLFHQLPRKKRELLAFCFFSHERSPPCPGLYFCVCSGSAKPILAAEEGGLVCSTCPHLGKAVVKAVVTLPVAIGEETGLNTSLLLSELCLNRHHNTLLLPMCQCVFFIKHWHGFYTVVLLPCDSGGITV